MTQYYSDLLELATAELPSLKQYDELSRIAHTLVWNHLEGNRIQMVGFAPRVDWLLRERGADDGLWLRVNDFRHRISSLDTQREKTLRDWFADDLKTLARFTALVTGEDIPEELRKLLPRRDRRRSSMKKFDTDCLRVVADHWDSRYLYVRPETDRSSLLRVDYGAGDETRDDARAYLPEILRPDCRLNLVAPRVEDETLYPELIIYEPDFLINISEIAACWREYGITPLTHLVNRLQAKDDTQATLLGNFASQLLDEDVNTGIRPYTDSIMDFFRHNAITLSAVRPTPDFHRDARLQQRNIHYALTQQLTLLPEYNPQSVELEPSFVSEMLGLQGRMDFLQWDKEKNQAILIEQKSGKAEFIPFDHFEIPKAKTTHYVQLVLYQALLHYNHKLRNKDIQSFLLYSKYSKPLLKTPAAPALLYRAFRLRNQIVALELRLAQPEGREILDSLTPEALNVNNISGKLWNDYVLPQLRALTDPLHTASDLEREYYFRFFRFLQVEYLKSKTGNEHQASTGVAALWTATLAQKREAGEIYTDLALDIPAEERPVGEVDFTIGDDSSDDLANFRAGDAVMFYRYEQGTVPDCRKGMVQRGILKDITGDRITVRLRQLQSNTAVFETGEGECWALEHDNVESSSRALFRGLQHFLSCSPDRRDLILTRREPRRDPSVTLQGDYGAFNDLVLKAKQSEDIFLLVGPPGTGKTSFGLLNILREALLTPGQTVLLASYTNRAVDEICSKLTEQGIDFLRIGHPLSCDPAYHSYLLENRVAELRDIQAVSDLIREARVVVGTTSTLGSHTELWQLRGFDLAIIDEASQILEPHLLPLLCALHNGKEAIRKFVLIGDHKQLPAVVQQNESETRVEEESLREIGLMDCSNSLFQRWHSRIPDDFVWFLDHQGRMHVRIAEWPSRKFYGGRLLPSSDWQQTDDGQPRCFFHDVPTPVRTPTTVDKVNHEEASLIARLVSDIRTSHPDWSIGIIVPYRHQMAAVRRSLDTPVPGLMIDTVERFQGSQRDVIIYGFTVQRPYQLDFLTSQTFTDTDGSPIDRKLNVALTRARQELHVVGSAALLKRNELFRDLIEWASTPNPSTRGEGSD